MYTYIQNICIQVYKLYALTDTDILNFSYICIESHNFENKSITIH